jgi:hypothetical protein
MEGPKERGLARGSVGLATATIREHCEGRNFAVEKVLNGSS